MKNKRCGVLALLISIQALAAAPPASHLRVMDRVVALVNGEPLTLTQLDFEARVALIQQGALDAANAPLDAQALAAALDYAIGERLEANEADKLQVSPVDEAQVSQALRNFQERLGGPSAMGAFLLRHDFDVPALAALLGRGLKAQRLLESKLRLRAQVSEPGLRRYYEAHAADFQAPYESVKGGIKDKLTREKFRALAVEELSTLRRASDVRVVYHPQEATP